MNPAKQKAVPLEIFKPDWPLTNRVTAGTVLRQRYDHNNPYAAMNFADHVGDDPASIAANRRHLQQHIGATAGIQWLTQQHGNQSISIENVIATPIADACLTTTSRLACAVLTADCLPILLCDEKAHCVAAIHAGWRGLAGGIVEHTVANMRNTLKSRKNNASTLTLYAWLGPAIGPDHFEVGDDVLQAFLSSADGSISAADGSAADGSVSAADGFGSKTNGPKSKQSAHPIKCHSANETTIEEDSGRAAVKLAFKTVGEKLHADLYQLATLQLNACGVLNIYGGGECSTCDAERFYSYRREPITGRMASFILRH